MGTRSILDRALGWPALAAALAAASVYGCQVERTHDPGDTLHPSGFTDSSSPDFHGTLLIDRGFPLAECRECHGDDYAGGAVQSSCVSGGCHVEGVESCATCHLAQPISGNHAEHEGEACTSCHPARTDARHSHHPDGVIDFAFGALASAGNAMPAFDTESQTCSNVYCHGTGTAKWGADQPLVCGSCHEAPPAWHAQIADTLPATGDVDFADTECVRCHGSGAKHIDGELDTVPMACDTCHGKGPLGAPPPTVDGAMAAPAIGAHQRHLDATLSDRIGHVARCDDCHEVPSTADALGHIDAAAPADVTLHSGEAYTFATKRCDVACHWNVEPGPVWDDTSGAARECDACHGFPPVKTRTGTAHPPAPAELDVCLDCHVFDPERHVDGQVDFAW